MSSNVTSRQRKMIMACLAVILTVLFTVYVVNYAMLQRPLAGITQADPQGGEMEIRVFYRHGVMPDEVNYDVRRVSGELSAADMTRVFLKYAQALKERDYKKVHLLYKGEDRFYIEGSYFKTLGVDLETQNPLYTLRTMPENIYNPDGTRAFETWTGGVLGVLGKQMEDFTELHKKWYLNAFIEEMRGHAAKPGKSQETAALFDEVDKMTDVRQLSIVLLAKEDRSDALGFRCDEGKVATTISHRGYFSADDSVMVTYRFDKEDAKKERFLWTNKADTAVRFNSTYFLEKALRAGRMLAQIDTETAMEFDLAAAKTKLNDFEKKCSDWRDEIKAEAINNKKK